MLAGFGSTKFVSSLLCYNFNGIIKDKKNKLSSCLKVPGQKQSIYLSPSSPFDMATAAAIFSSLTREEKKTSLLLSYVSRGPVILRLFSDATVIHGKKKKKRRKSE